MGKRPEAHSAEIERHFAHCHPCQARAAITWQAFCRQAIDGRSATEVAAETGLTLNAVILAKSRVMKRLRIELRCFV